MAKFKLSKSAEIALQTLGLQISIARKERQWSQAELAKRVGVNRQTIINIEKGNGSVAAGSLFEAAALTGVSLFAKKREEQLKNRDTAQIIDTLLPERIHVKKVKVDNDF